MDAETSRNVGPMTTPTRLGFEAVPGADFDAAGFVRRARRLADLSQRDLAAAVGTSPSRIARMESGGQRVGLAPLSQILGLAGLRLAVLDVHGREIRPEDAGVVRDNAGRRFPAHLDVQPPDLLPREVVSSPRYDRQPPKGWYHLREERDLQRTEGHTPVDHPTTTELRARRRRRLQTRRPAGPPSARAAPECDCPTACWLGRACEPSCVCQCEPAGRRSG